MKLRYSVKTAAAGLTTHKSRSILTILGIVIGITAIILVMSLGEGAQNLILDQIQSIGAKTIAIVPGRHPRGPADIIATFTDSLKEKDLIALSKKSNVPHAAEIMPVVFGSESVAYERETYRATLFGVTDLFAKIYKVYPGVGRLFTDEEVRGYADVVLLGSKVKKELFGADGAVGKKVRIKGKNLRVIGVFDPEGQLSFMNVDEFVSMPYTTAQRYIFGIKHFNRIVVEADKEANVQITVSDITRTLRQSHNITDPSKDDFFIETQADAMEIVGTITGVLTWFLAAIAAISLLVGGVGIMNIMLVSVTERTREIGLRKAVGATGRDIMIQFLMEAVVITAIGGLIGIFLGAAFSFAISSVLSRFLGLDWQFTFPFEAALLGFGVAAFVGLVFGLYPARQASRKSPIEALQYE
ncbi:ABC transporter permease [Candidatus Wolfebacteria bacterium]|nr:ABC transporter permease [Candidatus Wolfebacteria bacterium]